MNESLRRMLPASITFIGLVCGFAAVVLALHQELARAGICILGGYILDALDGEVARRLRVESAFGLQLDSLSDIVTFGIAPSVLAYQYSRQLSITPAITWVVCSGYIVGGAFRLARFNLLPHKGSQSDNIGLTISTSGATLVLIVLANGLYDQGLFPEGVFPVLIVVLTLLMISRIRYPALFPLVRRLWLDLVGLSILGALAIWLSPQLVGLGLAGSYVSFGLIRAIYNLIR